RRALPDRRHLGADGDGRDHDDAGPRHHAREAGELRAEFLVCRAAGGEARRDAVRAERGRLPDHQEAVAVDAARDPRRSRALREAVLVRDQGRVLHRRRITPGPGRLLLGDGACRRRAERRRSPAGHGGDRERAGLAPGRRGGSGRRTAARAEGPGDLRVRHTEGRSRAVAGAEEGAVRPRGEGDRRAGAARRDPVHGVVAEDAVRQDHAAAAARDRNERRGAGRRDDAGGHGRHQPPLHHPRRRGVNALSPSPACGMWIDGRGEGFAAFGRRSASRRFAGRGDRTGSVAAVPALVVLVLVLVFVFVFVGVAVAAVAGRRASGRRSAVAGRRARRRLLAALLLGLAALLFLLAPVLLLLALVALRLGWPALLSLLALRLLLLALLLLPLTAAVLIVLAALLLGLTLLLLRLALLVLLLALLVLRLPP